MNKKYLEKLVEHEMWTYFREYCSDTKQALVLLGWVALNSIGDYLWSDQAQFNSMEVSINQITFTWTSPEINEILLDVCKWSPACLEELIQKNRAIKMKLKSWASFWEEEVLLRKTWKSSYKSFDWMHRIVWHILQWKTKIKAYVLMNEWKFMPNCEPHVIYDIIKAYHRSDKSDQDAKDFIWALRLLWKYTWNAKNIIENRFNKNYLKDKDIQKLISESLKTMQ